MYRLVGYASISLFKCTYSNRFICWFTVCRFRNSTEVLGIIQSIFEIMKQPRLLFCIVCIICIVCYSVLYSMLFCIVCLIAPLFKCAHQHYFNQNCFTSAEWHSVWDSQCVPFNIKTCTSNSRDLRRKWNGYSLNRSK